MLNGLNSSKKKNHKIIQLVQKTVSNVNSEIRTLFLDEGQLLCRKIIIFDTLI